jgi:hypothetical protein
MALRGEGKVKTESDFSGAVAEFIPMLDSRINKIMAEEDEADEPKSREDDLKKVDRDHS